MLDSGNMIDAAEKIGTTFEALLADLSVQDLGEARVAACLYLTIAELHIAIIAVLRSSAQSHAPVLIRSMLEAFVDLKNIIMDSAHINQMHFNNAKQALKTFTGFQEASGMQDENETQKTIAEWKKEAQKTYDELKGKKFKELKIAEKFKQVGMIDEYATTYGFLCSFAHSDLNTLIARHASVDRYLRFTDTLPLPTLKSLLSITVNLYIQAVETLPKYTHFSSEKIKIVIDSANFIWSAATAT